MNEQTAIPVSVEAESHQGEFVILKASFRGNGHLPGLEIANEEKLITPDMYVAAPPTGDAKQYAERPHLVHVPEKGGMPRDFEELGGI
ncbi:Protein of uncharacterised function (DUF1629) [Achromobacter xylosoxidans]|nr:Protein of uncharacterised function (DUF1629) [Achromobacter xylosoxidans]CUI93115.1 Protein of uncharacterised function (DUF1629) [Achromobacter xylosoxidans]